MSIILNEDNNEIIVKDKPDTTGFILDTTNQSSSLVFKYSSGVSYPVICRSAPYTNFEWKNYEVSGTLIKPSGVEYDGMDVGVVFYMQDKENYYKLVARGANNGDNNWDIMRSDGAILFELPEANGVTFSGDVDTINFKVIVYSQDVVTPTEILKDKKVKINAMTWTNSNASTMSTNISDISEDRIISGYTGVIIDNELFTNGQILKIDNFRIKKMGE